MEVRQHSNLQRIIREAVTNALRHSDTDTLQIDIQLGTVWLTVKVSNNNVHLKSGEQRKSGRGMRNIRSRAEELDGHAEWYFGEAALLGGYTVKITVPLGEREKDE
jgi:signal transduction histidine kinase